jgi:hypothetical protein
MVSCAGNLFGLIFYVVLATIAGFTGIVLQGLQMTTIWILVIAGIVFVGWIGVQVLHDNNKNKTI